MRRLLIESQDELKEAHHKWIETEMKQSQMVSQIKWTQSIAVGDKSFVERIKDRLGVGSKGRKILEEDDDYQLRYRKIGYGDSVQFNIEGYKIFKYLPFKFHLKIVNRHDSRFMFFSKSKGICILFCNFTGRIFSYTNGVPDPLLRVVKYNHPGIVTFLSQYVCNPFCIFFHEKSTNLNRVGHFGCNISLFGCFLQFRGLQTYFFF